MTAQSTAISGKLERAFLRLPLRRIRCSPQIIGKEEGAVRKQEALGKRTKFAKKKQSRNLCGFQKTVHVT